MARASGRGRFITLEGMDGAGKSTHQPWIAQLLRAPGREIVQTREPGGTPLAEKLRHLVLADPMEPFSETLLMFAARAEHVAKLIAPALERGAWVLCDRFSDSTLAYQAGGKGVPRELVTRLAEQAHPGLHPDRTLVFDCSFDVSRARLGSAGRALDRFEREERAFFERVRAVYREMAAAEPARMRLIDGGREAGEVRAMIRAGLAGLEDG